MGKTKQKRHKASKPRPTGLPSVRDFEAEVSANGASTSASHTVANVIDKLTSPNVEEREYACSVISSCANTPDRIPELLRLDVIRVLAPLIVDPNNHIRQSALGALRNLSVDGGPDVCKELVLKDVLTPLIALFNQYSVGWIPEHCQSKRKPDIKVEVYIQALHLLANLCESTDVAVTVFNKENLSRFLLPCLNCDLYGYPLSIAAAQCLYSVSEENPDVAGWLRQSENQAVLEGLASSQPNSSGQLLLRTLALGVLCNCNSSVIAKATGDVMVAMVTKLADVITQDATERLKLVAENLRALIPAEKGKKEKNGSGDKEMADHSETGALHSEEVTDGNGGGTGDAEKMEEEPVAMDNKPSLTNKVEVEVELEDIQYLLTAQQVSLELLTNICVAEDDGEEWEDMDSSSSSSDDMTSLDTAMVTEDDTVDNNNSFNTLCIPTEVHSAFLSNDLLNKVISKASYKDIPPEIRESNEDSFNSLDKSMRVVQSHALLCLNNLVTCLEASALGGVDNLHNIWLTLLKILPTSQGPENSSLLEAVTSAMRAVIQKLAAMETNKFSEVSGPELEFIFNLGKSCSISQVRVNAVRVISTIGCILATLKQPHPCLKDIGMFLVEVSWQDSDLWVTAEALDSLFDVFGEDHLDPVVREIGVVDKLNKLVPILKSKMSNQRKHLGEHYPVISTARTNLVRFIKYKTATSAQR